MSIETNNTNTSDPSVDPASPYFLHPSDASFILISTPFSGNNFNDWKRAMTIALSAKNKLGFIDGTIPKPAPNTSFIKAWERVNSTLITWFMKVLDPTIARSILHFVSTAAIWTNLIERFGQTSSTQVYDYLQQLAEIEQGNDSISTFFTKLQILWDKQDAAQPLPTCTCNNCKCNLTSKLLKLQEEQRLISFLMKLNASFKHVRANIIMQYPLPSITHVYRLLIQEEKHKELSDQTPNTESHALFSNKKQFFNNSSSSVSSYKPQHLANRGGYTIRTPMFCDYCKRQGHTKDKCFKIRGYPQNVAPKPQWKGAKVAAVAHNDDSDKEDSQPDHLALIPLLQSSTQDFSI